MSRIARLTSRRSLKILRSPVRSRVCPLTLAMTLQGVVACNCFGTMVGETQGMLGFGREFCEFSAGFSAMKGRGFTPIRKVRCRSRALAGREFRGFGREFGLRGPVLRLPPAAPNTSNPNETKDRDARLKPPRTVTAHSGRRRDHLTGAGPSSSGWGRYGGGRQVAGRVDRRPGAAPVRCRRGATSVCLLGQTRSVPAAARFGSVAHAPNAPTVAGRKTGRGCS